MVPLRLNQQTAKGTLVQNVSNFNMCGRSGVLRFGSKGSADYADYRRFSRLMKIKVKWSSS